MMKNILATKFNYRIVCCFAFVVFLMFGSVVRLFAVALDDQNAKQTNCVRVKIANGRGMIYDANGEILCGTPCYANVILPFEGAKNIAKKYCGDEADKACETLQKNKPYVFYSPRKISEKGVYSAATYDRTDVQSGLEHIVGYVNGENHGVAGIEKAYDNLLYSKENIELNFAVDAAGNYLLGEAPNQTGILNESSVTLSIYRPLQNYCNEILNDFDSAAVVVNENATGLIRAMVSKPGYNTKNVAAALKSQHSPLLNKALCCYNVGSVFKPLVAAVLLENNKGNITANCAGSMQIGNRKFYCHNHSGHGNVNLAQGLMYSCNCYFYNAIMQLNMEDCLNLATSLEFFHSIPIANGIAAAAGSCETLEELNSFDGNKANFAIGQGKLMLSPLALSNLYAAIANGGYYIQPKLCVSTMSNAVEKPTEPNHKTYVFSAQTAEEIKNNLCGVLKSGTGKAATPNNTTAFGKTATAQTGKFSDGEEVTHSWFCGCFPAEKPQYTVTVFVKDSKTSKIKATEVFKKIADFIKK